MRSERGFLVLEFNFVVILRVLKLLQCFYESLVFLGETCARRILTIDETNGLFEQLFNLIRLSLLHLKSSAGLNEIDENHEYAIVTVVAGLPRNLCHF